MLERVFGVEPNKESQFLKNGKAFIVVKFVLLWSDLG